MMWRKVLAAAVILLAASCFVHAQGTSITNFTVPYTSYLYDFWEKAVPSPQAYLPSKIVRGEDLQVGALNNPNDLFVSEQGEIYILDTGNNRVVVADQDFKLLREISAFGDGDSFSSPMGVFVTPEGHIYVADTGKGRIVHLNPDGSLNRIVPAPQAELEGVLPANFNYRPLKVGVDEHGRIYVIAQDLYEGLISFSADGQFRGFLGAPRVTPSLADYLWSRFATKEQRQRIRAFLPTEYTNFDLDPEGFIYATSHAEDKTEEEGGIAIKVRRINAKGDDLLRRLGFSIPMGDVEFPDRWSTATRRTSSMLVDITVQPYGVYSVLDGNRGRVFTYDNNGNLLYDFSYSGTGHGQLASPAAIDALGKTMLVLDSKRGGIVVFEPTDYALLIWAALDAYERGDYYLAEKIWGQLLVLNSNFDVAYTGIGRALLRRDEYAEAMENFRLGNNRTEYSDAFELYRKELVYEYFPQAFAVFVVVLAAIFVTRRLWAARRVRPAAQEAAATGSKRRRFGQKTLESLRFGLYAIVHPFDGFERLKKERKGTPLAATIILALVVLTFVFARQYTGFIFNRADLSKINLLVEIGSVVLPFLLWTFVNWALTTLMEGKGTLKDVYIASAFALIPVIIAVVPLTIVSNFLIQEEGAFYYMLMSAGLGWAVVLLIVGATMVTHEYDFRKTIFTCISTLMGMAFALFLGLLFVALTEQVIMFIRQLLTEAIHRT
ncbi:MAG: YIP1 family protein [Bacillota bacterium]|nr:YIP1 family protein [Bacillota bacterium]